MVTPWHLAKSLQGQCKRSPTGIGWPRVCFITSFCKATQWPSPSEICRSSYWDWKTTLGSVANIRGSGSSLPFSTPLPSNNFMETRHRCTDWLFSNVSMKPLWIQDTALGWLQHDNSTGKRVLNSCMKPLPKIWSCWLSLLQGKAFSKIPPFERPKNDAKVQWSNLQLQTQHRHFQPPMCWTGWENWV